VDEMNYIERHHKIIDRVRLHYEYAIRHYGRENVLGVFLYGSQNYECDNEGADVDTKCILLPDLYHLAIRPYETTHLHIPREEGQDPEVCECMTLQHMVANWKKQNPNFLEIMFTHFYVLNPEYEDIWWDYIDNHREDIARYDVRQGVMSVAHQAKNTIKQGPFDGKKIGNGFRLLHLLSAYDAGKPYKECLIPDVDCPMIKRLKAGKEPVQVFDAEILTGAFDEMIAKYEGIEIGKNKAIECSLENFIMDMIRRRIMNED
jgi:hypothetical protein